MAPFRIKGRVVGKGGKEGENIWGGMALVTLVALQDVDGFVEARFPNETTDDVLRDQSLSIQ